MLLNFWHKSPLIVLQSLLVLSIVAFTLVLASSSFASSCCTCSDAFFHRCSSLQIWSLVSGGGRAGRGSGGFPTPSLDICESARECSSECVFASSERASTQDVMVRRLLVMPFVRHSACCEKLSTSVFHNFSMLIPSYNLPLFPPPPGLPVDRVQEAPHFVNTKLNSGAATLSLWAESALSTSRNVF